MKRLLAAVLVALAGGAGAQSYDQRVAAERMAETFQKIDEAEMAKARARANAPTEAQKRQTAYDRELADSRKGPLGGWGVTLVLLSLVGIGGLIALGQAAKKASEKF